ncbi:MipA/OmpV family protein [Rhodospirillaceae bacterium KN72]|uniref:MipA/OmpV family protein n=1 Tax=Pacificispira spongiicola TaxID=2729598 RepID=A0A7Y0HD97_9PROT|nr:MipA/OmpV family protein [Pacificispira spongiicola]NMM43430.1 MipA/OmpV family protein [Pacificispira spongiicola]
MTRDSGPTRPFTIGILFATAVLMIGIPSPTKADSTVRTATAEDDGSSTEKQGSDHWVLGIGAAIAPTYEGSDEYAVDPVPLVDVKYGRFFAKTGSGIGLNVVETDTITAGVGVNWMKGYDEDDVATGIDGVDDAFGARLFVSGRVRGFVTTLATTQAVTETDRGMTVNATVAYPVRPTDRLTITPSLGTTWANEKYMNSYFGIDASEAAASGYAQYEPSGGFKNVTFRVAAGYRITDSINAVGSIGISHILGDAADSPLVKEDTSPSALIGLSYSF